MITEDELRSLTDEELDNISNTLREIQKERYRANLFEEVKNLPNMGDYSFYIFKEIDEESGEQVLVQFFYKDGFFLTEESQDVYMKIVASIPLLSQCYSDAHEIEEEDIPYVREKLLELGLKEG